MSSITPNLGLFKYDTITDGDIAFNLQTALNNNWDIIDNAVSSGSSRNIGEIVSSTIPLTDAGLHLLDGSLINGNGIYSDFVDYIASIYDPTANYFCTEAEWQTAVTTYGVCGKFVYDSVNNTVRLPKVTGIIEGTVDVSALGDLVEAGLPNITGTFSRVQDKQGFATGCFYRIENIIAGDYADSSRGISTGFNASLSNSIYGNSNTVQPQAIKYYYYIVIATSTKTDIQVDIDEIATDLNGKADKDLSNITPTQNVKNTIVGWGMPDYSAGITTGYNTSFVAPCDGIGMWCVRGNYATILIRLGSSASSPFLAMSAPDVNTANSTSFLSVPLNKGETYYIAFSSNITEVLANTFYPLKGVN